MRTFKIYYSLDKTSIGNVIIKGGTEKEVLKKFEEMIKNNKINVDDMEKQNDEFKFIRIVEVIE